VIVTKPLRTKLIMLIISFLLLAAVVVYMTTAWFTKMVSVTGMDFSVAKWDFTANQMLGDMIVNVYEYSSLSDKLAAPGTAGYIPLELSAEKSDTDLDYYVTVDKTSMSAEFQERIHFYYDAADGTRTEFLNAGNDMSGIITKGTTKTVYIYWVWDYEPSYANSGSLTAEQQKELDAYNEFDTEVGKKPTLYVKYMDATVKIAGAQVVPTA
jgi:hypothetical protein